MRRLALLVAAVTLAGCPLGCPKGKPQTIYEGPVDEVHLEQTGKCTWRAVPPLQHPYPFDDHPQTGCYFVELNDEGPVFLDWVTYDPKTATFTLKEKFCAIGITAFHVSWHSLVTTVNE